jgi:DNA-binding MltR family transcriptional regulator
MAKKTKKNTDHSPRHWDTLLDREFQNESDRASVILAAALLDSALEVLLKAFLAPSSNAEDTLFDGTNAPLGTFSGRIEMAYRLQLIDAAFARNLHLVRRIRNDFAHNISGCTFADSAVVGRLTELRRSSGVIEDMPKVRKLYPAGARGDFQTIVSWLQWMLRSVAEDIRPVDPSITLAGNCLSDAYLEPTNGVADSTSED